MLATNRMRRLYSPRGTVSFKNFQEGGLRSCPYSDLLSLHERLSETVRTNRQSELSRLISNGETKADHASGQSLISGREERAALEDALSTQK